LSAALLLASLLPAAVQAHYMKDRCVRSDGKALYDNVAIPVGFNIGRDAGAGDVIGPWIRYPLTWTCTHKGIGTGSLPHDQFTVRTRLYITDKFNPGPLYVYGGRSYRMYRHPSKNIGLIAHLRQQIAGSQEVITPLTVNTAGWNWDEWMDSAGPPRKHGGKASFHTTLEMRLVKLNDDPIAPGWFKAVQLDFSSTTINKLGKPEFEVRDNIHYSLGLSVFNVQAACTTPGATVDLGTTRSSSLSHPGDVGPATDFAVSFKNCPKGMATVQYTFQPVPRQPVTDGILPLVAQPDSATGVGVQVLQPDGAPLKFNTPFPLSAYNPTAPAPLYEVPLKARIIRTHNSLSGGSVQALMEMEVTYK